MKKHIFAVLICIITVFSVCTTALADISVEIDSETHVLTAKIHLPGAENKAASIEVFNPGKTPDDIASITPDSVMSVFDYIREGKFDSTGRLILSYTLDGESGYHFVRISPEGMEPVLYPDAFLFVSPEFEENFLQSYCANETTNVERLELIEENASILGINNENIADFDSDQNLSLIAFMGNAFESLDELKNAYALAIVAHSIKSGPSTDVTGAYFDVYKNELTDVCPVFGLYELYISDSDKNGFYKSFDSSKLNNYSDFISELGEKTILYSLKCLKNHQETENILRTCESYLDEDFSDYYALKDKKQINLELIKADLQSNEDMAEKVHKLAEKYKPKKDKESGGGGGSSSSSFSGPPVNVVVPPVLDETVTPDEKPGVIFDDLTDCQWAQKAIYSLYDRGVISGVSENLFEPHRQITREEFTKLVVEALFEVDKNAVATFEDVPQSHWCSSYVETACRLGIVNGISETKFGVGEPISRQDMTLILHRAINSSNINISKIQTRKFTDESSISPYAAEAVQKISEYGIISGFEDGSFAPLKSASRAEAAKIICETLVKGGILND